MEINGGSMVSYLARTPCVPSVLYSSVGLETEGLVDFQGRAGITLEPDVKGAQLAK